MQCLYIYLIQIASMERLKECNEFSGHGKPWKPAWMNV